LPGLLAAVILVVAGVHATAGEGSEGADWAGPAVASIGVEMESGVAPRDSDVTEAGEASAPAAYRHAQPWHQEPKYIMMRSIVVPGWGQLANGRSWKALLVAAVETYFVWRAVHYGRRERDFRRQAGEHLEDSFTRSDLYRQADYAGDRRRDSVWWAIFSVVLSMGDAYVDAHLGRDFEVEFEPQDRGHGGADGREVGFRVGIRRCF